MSISAITELINNDKHIDAIALINNFLQDDPENEELYYVKGKLLQKLNLWDSAITAYRKAIELNEDSKANVALEMLYGIVNDLNNKIVDS